MQKQRWTIAAIGLVAMVVATVAHEAAGHGGACLALGGRITLLTSVYFHCLPSGPWIDIAGPLGNAVAALLAWLLLSALPAGAARARLFALLVFAFSAFWFAGYMVYSLLLQKGDYFLALREFAPGAAPLVRFGLAGLGAVLYAASMGVVARQSFAQSVMKTAWTAAALGAVAAAALFAPDRLGAMKDALLEIGLAALPLLLTSRRQPAGPEIAPSALWIVPAVLLYAVFAWTMGAGLSQG